jgi:hypothetical protein
MYFWVCLIRFNVVAWVRYLFSLICAITQVVVVANVNEAEPVLQSFPDEQHDTTRPAVVESCSA